MKLTIIIFSLILSFSILAKTSHLLSPSDAKKMINKEQGNRNFKIIDIRREYEYKAGRIKDAELIDYTKPIFEIRVNTLPKENIYLIYCRSGRKSGEAFTIMKKTGLKKVFDIKGGINAWVQSGLDIEK